jgi:hypothetical protein
MAAETKRPNSKPANAGILENIQKDRNSNEGFQADWIANLRFDDLTILAAMLKPGNDSLLDSRF